MHVQHVKEIVATQQSYAKVCGVIEEVSLPDAGGRRVPHGPARLGPAPRRAGARFRRCALIMGDKHLILQILLNLLRNAKEAIKLGPNDDRVIRVRIARHVGDRVRIQVTDSGIGLPHENLTRIFAHGFTTKEGGHGFGLHSGALAAQQMGGSLRGRKRRSRLRRDIHPGTPAGGADGGAA
jgi:signal transduction histidine kinase